MQFSKYNIHGSRTYTTSINYWDFFAPIFVPLLNIFKVAKMFSHGSTDLKHLMSFRSFVLVTLLVYSKAMNEALF